MKLNIPKGWGEVTIRQFHVADDLLGDDSIELVDKHTRLLSHFSGVPVKDIEDKVLLPDYKQYVADLQFITDTDSLPKVVPEYVTLDDKLFYVNKDISKLTAGEGIELLKYSEGSMWPNIHKVIALFLWPAEPGMTAKPRHATLDERNELAGLIYDHMTVEQAWPLSLFFCNVFTALLPDIVDYLEKRAPKELEKIFSRMSETSSMPSGGGSPSLTVSQVETQLSGEPSLSGRL